jgi:hypothetical protein
MQEPIADRIGQRRIPHVPMPLLERALARDHRGGGPIAIFHDLEQVFAFCIGQGGQQQIVQDQHRERTEFGEEFEMGAIGAGLLQALKEPRRAHIEDREAGTSRQMSKACAT